MIRHKPKTNIILSLIWIVLSLNGIISFAYAAFKGDSPETLWALFSVNFLFISSMTQSGVIFSAIMRVVRARWDCSFAKTGEMITLSTAPLCLIMFVILYAGGIFHIYSKVSVPPSNFWRNILTMGMFYGVSYYYYYACALKENNITTKGNMEKRLNILTFAVILLYVIHNTILAWDLGMTIIPEWESTIFPPYYWTGGIFAGTALIFIVHLISMAGRHSKPPEECNYRSHHLLHHEIHAGWINCSDHMGKLLLGFTLLWTYMLWSQYIVIWYGDIPRLTGPLLRQMSGTYGGTFILMLMITFIIPFILLIQKRIRTSAIALLIVSLLICIGIWLNRFLMILPVYSNDATHLILSWTGISLMVALASAAMLSVSVLPLIRHDPTPKCHINSL